MSDNSAEKKIILTTISVVLVADSNNPTIINPDFLSSNNVLVEGLQLREPPITTPVYSQVIYQGGISVKAEPNRVIFEQAETGTPLQSMNIVSPEMAVRYVENVPHVPYNAIGINPVAIRCLNDGSKEKLSRSLSDNGTWTSFKDVMPEIQFKAIYGYEMKTINLDIAESKKREQDGTELFGLVFRANIHRDIKQTTQQGRISELKSIIKSWDDDLKDFCALIDKFEFRRFV